MPDATSRVFHISSSPGYQVDMAVENRLSSILSIVHPNVGATKALTDVLNVGLHFSQELITGT